MKLVYVAGPISSDPMLGTRQAVLAMDRLFAAGLGPVVPHLSVLAQMIAPQPYEAWMGLDFELVGRCDAVLRLRGESSGADREVQHARKLGIPVFLDLDQCVAEMGGEVAA